MAKRGPITAPGDRQGRWTILDVRGAWCLCRCDCGSEREVRKGDLRSGRSSSCGCVRSEFVAGLKRKPPGTQVDGTPTYRTWIDMKRRCHQPHRPDFHRYGGRGVRVCDRWRSGADGATGYECFLSDMGERPKGRTLDRIDVDGDYEPGNCRWATKSEQDNNRRTCRVVEFDGEAMTVAEVARRTGVVAATLYARLRRGLSIEEAVHYERRSLA